MKITAAALKVAAEEFGVTSSEHCSTMRHNRKFKSNFGMNLHIARKLCNHVDQCIEKQDITKSPWFLATLFFLKHCPTVDILACRLEADCKTVRKWVWKWCEHFSLLDLVGHNPIPMRWAIQRAQQVDTLQRLEWEPEPACVSSDYGGWNPFCEDDSIDSDPDFSAV